MIEAYIDESAKTLLGRPLYSVAGLFGTCDQWRRFEDVWSAVLDTSGVAYYHGKDRKCDPLRPLMVSAIRTAGVRGITSTAFEDDFSRAGNELKSILGNHYSYLAVSIALQIRDWAKGAKVGPVTYILEDGQPNIEHVIKVINTVIGPDAASVSSAGKRDYVGLQAADFLAHQSGALDQGLAWLQQLLGDGPGQVMWGHLDSSGIARASTGMSQLLRRHRHQKSRAKRGRKMAKLPK